MLGPMAVSREPVAPPSLSALRARGPIALFLDFDGTLVEIAPGPEAIRVPRDLGPRIEKLGKRLDGRLALVTGRALDNLESHLGPLRVARAGSHGAARKLADGAALGESPAPLPDAACQLLREFSQTSGLLLETKPHGAALHFRARPERESEVAALASELAGEFGLLVKSGKSVVELVSPGAGKDGAVRAFMAIAPFEGAVPVFIGDDVTDEDGFRAAGEFGGWGIAVGERPSQAARYRLDGVGQVYEWLEL